MKSGLQTHRMAILTRVIVAAGLAGVGAAAVMNCGGGSSAEPSPGCQSVPACYADALTALRACVPTSSLTLVRGTAGSGVISGLGCTGPSMTVAFSDISESPTGLVSSPGDAILNSAGALCAKLVWGTGTSTNGSTGVATTFDTADIQLPSGANSQVRKYTDGSIGITCGPGSNEVVAPAGGLDACLDSVQFPKAVRTDSGGSISSMQVNLLDPHDTPSTLFVCS